MTGARDAVAMTTGPWAIRVSRAEASAVAAALRLWPNLRGGIGGDNGADLWLRGDAMDESLERLIRRLAPAARFAVIPAGGDDEELVPHTQLLPVARLPRTLDWLPLHELFAVDRPTPALPGSKPAPIKVTIVRSDTLRPAAMLRASLASWADYVSTAPGVRLRGLRFAATADEVLVAGEPLPPLPGVRLWEGEGVVVPCGWTWSPPVDARTLRRALALRDHDVALFAEDGTWQYVPAEGFGAARRSAVRRTAAANRPEAAP
jgi:hypothetical protein